MIRRVVGDSMLPSLKPGQIVVALTKLLRLNVGDVVVIDHDGLQKIKRITEIQLDKLYVLGDNTSNSTDSRHFGWINTYSVLGKVIYPRTKRVTQKFQK